MADAVRNYEQSEILTTLKFTTLEGLYQAIQQIPHEFPFIRRGEVYIEDRAGNAIGNLRLRVNLLPDGSRTYDAVLAPADDKDLI